MLRLMLSKMSVVLCLAALILVSGCHYALTAFYTGGPEVPRDIVDHSETWHVVSVPAGGHDWIAMGDTIRFEHSGSAKRPIGSSPVSISYSTTPSE